MPDRKFEKLTKIIFLLISLLAFAPFSGIFSQIEKPRKTTGKFERTIANKIQKESEIPVEKSIETAPDINILLCVSEGNLKINGWDRNEVRAFVSNGSQIGFRVIEKSKQSLKPIWIKILGFDQAYTKDNNPDECLSGDSIEIDVPRGASVGIKSNVSETTISSIAKVTVENGGGDIFISGIEHGIEARTYEGDVTVGKSSGAMSLSSTSGNITAFDNGPSEIGNVFKARTSNGTITLKNIAHRQLEANSNTGSINFNGEFAVGGQYSFNTSNGTINLTIPETSSVKIQAAYGYGIFNSEIALENLQKKSNSTLKSLFAQIGNGDATLKLTTISGAIRIKNR